MAEAGESAADSLFPQAKYSYCYSVYERCNTQMADMIAQVPQVQAVLTQSYMSSGCRLPPSDTEDLPSVANPYGSVNEHLYKLSKADAGRKTVTSVTWGQTSKLVP